MTLRTLTASTHKRYGNPVTHLPLAHVLAHRLDDTRQLVTGNMRQFDIRK